MDGGSPSRHQKKHSKKNQDGATIPKPSGRTKAACKRGAGGGSRAAHHHDDQGASTAAPPAPAPVGDVPMVDEEEEALDHAGRTIAAPPTHTPTRGSGFVSQLVPFTGVSSIMREPTMAPNPAGGWTPPLPVDYRHRVKDIRFNRGRNLYAEDEKDLRLEYRF